METESEIKNFNYEMAYMFVITAVCCILTFLFNKIIVVAVAAIFAVALMGIIILWKRKFTRQSLYIQDIMNCLAPVSFAYLLFTEIITYKESIIAIILLVIIYDVFSFTKSGKKTPNAKAISNYNSLIRLSICLPVPGKAGLLPIIGIGDLYFYSAMSSFSLQYFGVDYFANTLIVILTGQLLNIIAVALIKDKSWYKGLPATLFPGIAYLIFILVM